MEILGVLLNVVAYFGPYVLAAGAGGYAEYKFGSKLAARVSALEAKATAEVKAVSTAASAVTKAV